MEVRVVFRAEDWVFREGAEGFVGVGVGDVRRGERRSTVEATSADRVGRRFSGRRWGWEVRRVEIFSARWVWRWKAGGEVGC